MNAKTAKAWRVPAVVLTGVLASRCGVEVGNPHKPSTGTGSGGKAGALTLALADAPVDGAKHVYLDITGLRAVPASGAPVALDLANKGKIDALALRDGKSLDLSAAQSLPVGSYAGVVLDLNAAGPASIVGEDDAERPLHFSDGSQGMYVAQGFDVVEGQDLQITLHVDLRRSIDGDAFGPVAHMIRKGDEGQIAGQGAPAAAVSVCAYLRRTNDFDGGQFGRLPGGPQTQGPGPGGPGTQGPGPHGPGPDGPGIEGRHTARLPQTFAPDAAQVELDADAGCENAFATAAVSSGAYLLTHLWPGVYSLRFFDATGAPITPADGPVVTLTPGAAEHYDGARTGPGTGLRRSGPR
jgi:hypothetical protein